MRAKFPSNHSLGMGLCEVLFKLPRYYAAVNILYILIYIHVCVCVFKIWYTMNWYSHRYKYHDNVRFKFGKYDDWVDPPKRNEHENKTAQRLCIAWTLKQLDLKISKISYQIQSDLLLNMSCTPAAEFPIHWFFFAPTWRKQLGGLKFWTSQPFQKRVDKNHSWNSLQPTIYKWLEINWMMNPIFT